MWQAGMSGLQVAGDANVAGQVYPDQSLYPCNSVPALVERINNALQRADQIEHAEGNVKVPPTSPPCAAYRSCQGILSSLTV